MSDAPESQGYDLRGLFDDFEGYRTPTDDDYQRLLTAGLVVPDANVLLNLYRYDDSARRALLDVFGALGNLLWVPHQVLAEFWKNREAVLRDPRDTHKTVREMAEHRDRAIQLFRTWANRVSLDSDDATDMTALLSDAFASVADRINERDLEDASLYAQNTAEDPVLSELETLLNGRCGVSLNEAELDLVITEGMRRVDERIPPGYMDKAKGDRDAAGDYIVWEQILREASKRGVDVLFITGDAKEDWWRIDAGERRGPRLELAKEMRSRAGTRLFVLRPASLLNYAARDLSVDLPPGSAQEVDRVEQFLAESNSNGWAEESVSELLRRLDAEAPVQSDAIRRAALRGGFVTREEVYQLGRYDGERSLRGFTRPVNRISQELRMQGIVSENAPEVLATRYDGGVVATGFDLHPEVVQVLAPNASRIHILRLLHRMLRQEEGAGVSVDDLAVAAHVRTSALNVILDSLEADDLIVRTNGADPTDTITEITPAGRLATRMLYDLDVVTPKGDIEQADLELTDEVSRLLESGFTVQAAEMDGDGTARILIGGTVNEHNIELIRSLRNVETDTADQDDQ